MEIFLVVLAFLFLLIGLIGSVVPVLPGPPISFVGLLVLQWSGYGNFSTEFLLVWAAITAAVTIIDYILPAWMTKKFGGSRAAVIGSVVGLIVGLLFFPPLGLLVGSFLGAFAGELLNQRVHAGSGDAAPKVQKVPQEDGSVITVEIINDESGGTTAGGNGADGNAGGNGNCTAKALKVALGAFLAFIVGTGAKLIIAALMIYYAVKAVAFQVSDALQTNIVHLLSP